MKVIDHIIKLFYNMLLVHVQVYMYVDRIYHILIQLIQFTQSFKILVRKIRVWDRYMYKLLIHKININIRKNISVHNHT